MKSCSRSWRPKQKTWPEIRYPKIFIGKIDFHPMAQVTQGLGTLSDLTDASSTKEVREALTKIVPEMRDS